MIFPVSTTGCLTSSSVIVAGLLPCSRPSSHMTWSAYSSGHQVRHRCSTHQAVRGRIAGLAPFTQAPAALGAVHDEHSGGSQAAEPTQLRLRRRGRRQQALHGCQRVPHIRTPLTGQPSPHPRPGKPEAAVAVRLLATLGLLRSWRWHLGYCHGTTHPAHDKTSCVRYVVIATASRSLQWGNQGNQGPGV